MNETLSAKTCTPCQGGIPPLSETLASKYLAHADGWELQENSTLITRAYSFNDFKGAMDFVQRVGELAETEGHHPDVEFGWGYARVSLQTKKIKGLHENDFIMAAKINKFL